MSSPAVAPRIGPLLICRRRSRSPLSMRRCSEARPDGFNETGPTGAMVPSVVAARRFGALFADPFTYEITWNSVRLSLTATTLALLPPIRSRSSYFARSRFKTLLIVPPSRRCW